MKEYDLFLPLFYNDGVPIEAAKFQRVQEALLERFGGVTYFPQPNQGFWKFGNITYRDEIVIYRVITEDWDARAFIAELKDNLKNTFRQEEILIIERDVGIL